MTEEESNANAFLLAIAAINMSDMPVVTKYRAILALAESES